MTSPSRLKIATLVTLTAALLGAASANGQALPLPALVVPLNVTPTVIRYPTVDFGRTTASKDDRTGTTEWRVVGGQHDPILGHRATGNCCENFTVASPDGRIFDLGGNYLNFSDDRGRTWMSVRPLEPLVNGEGCVVVAPNGDVLGFTWDPYSGDRAFSFKYEAATKQWTYGEVPLHLPFYDRPWIEVIPGPLTVDGQTVPYVTFVQGGTGLKDPWLYSTDGIDYLHFSTRVLDQMRSATQEGPLPTTAEAGMDWSQPSTNGGVTPLGNGAALAIPYPPTTTSWGLLDGRSFTWTPFSLPGGAAPEGLYLVDSAARVHRVLVEGSAFEYGISTNGGRTWKDVDVRLPRGHDVEEIDFRANKALGVAAVAIHAHDSGPDKDVDLLFKLDISSDQARLTRQYRLGRGDVNASSGIGQTIRYDFATVALLPDGRAALSVLDSATLTHSLSMGDNPGPHLAIEGETALSGAEAKLPALKLTLAVRRRGARLVFTGTLKPRYARHRIVLQRRSGSRWVTFARTRTSSRSTFRLVRRMRARGTTRFRATAPATSTNRAGRSRTVRARGR